MSVDVSGAEATKVARRARVTAAALFVAAGCLLAAAGSVLFVWWQNRPVDVLGPFPEQQVLEHRVDGVPTVRVGDDVTVSAVKCYQQRVSIRGSVTWRAVRPGGVIVARPETSAVGIEPGCPASVYENQMPPEVEAAARRQHRQGYDAPLWVITGTETPELDSGRRGVAESWSTEPFAIVR